MKRKIWHYFDARDLICQDTNPRTGEILYRVTACGRGAESVKLTTPFRDRATCIKCAQVMNGTDGVSTDG